MAQINYLAALTSRIMASRRVRPPRFPDDDGAHCDHTPLAALLDHATDGWTVDYGIVRASSAFSDYIGTLAEVDPSTLGRDEQLAFWINAYNAQVLSLIAANRVSSIIEIPRVFTGLRVAVGGDRLTLDEIEHAKVRRFGNYRIHYALNCASVGCPPLRVYDASHLETQLEENAVRFLADERRGARLEDTKVHLAMVFRWFSGDFAPIGDMPSALGTIVSTVLPTRVLPAAREHLPAELCGATSVGFIPWDWTLNSAGS